MRRSRIKQRSSKVTIYSDNSPALVQLADSVRRGELVAIVGTGVSISLTDGQNDKLSWKGLIRDGLGHGITKGKISPEQLAAWSTQLKSNDIDDLLGAAEFMGRKLGAPDGDLYSRWLEGVFKSLQPAKNGMQRAVNALRDAGVPLCTLNYDHLLERATGLPGIKITEIAKVNAWMRREPSIFHLHGSWDDPKSCILGIRDYETTLGDGVRDLIQRALASFNRLLFIGCGDTFIDPNFSALIKWLREKMRASVPQHYAIVNDSELHRRHTDLGWHGFVEPLGYGKRYDDLPEFLLKLFPVRARFRKDLASSVTDHSEEQDQARLLRDYRAFLLKDCGQMTIEGVRADMDTAQRRFDLERLFVPLKILPCPPDLPDSDPQREQKLKKWQEKNSTPIPFGKVFERDKHLALLALPGGGKTLLLKRLAVAYADPARRRASTDALPQLDLMPVLIRCREWREHIHRPISTLLQNLPSITGQASLTGLFEAILPLLKQGRILLLVDGLDEIHDDSLRTTFVEHLESFLEEYRHIRLVVTSRQAGFNLVAPCLARFCQRWRVAPLESDAIELLCDHWHLLMKGDSSEARAEGRELASILLNNASLLRLAENPLLLTMLLVVKHGAGRLPPDRVSLYGRAVEVLLDTWNIKGHEPLNLKESVPQLAFIAFELMRAGKQTATERELLELLEQAREKVPQIRRYAKDAPHAFLKRVELRSSLLVEAGHQRDGSGTVPFYQFRHLTFQEYLAAVAAVEGHYVDYKKSDTLLTQLESYLTTEEWKEVIPMAAVLGRKQAETLIATLVSAGNKVRLALQTEQDLPALKEWATAYPSVLPAPIARLTQCLAEEADATPETIVQALPLVALFAKGCDSNHDWKALSRGPYGEELLHQAILIYMPMDWPEATHLDRTVANLSYYRRSDSYWSSHEGQLEIEKLLKSEDREQVVHGLFACVGILWGMEHSDAPILKPLCARIEAAERHLLSSDPAVCLPAEMLWALLQFHSRSKLALKTATLERITALWFTKVPSHISEWASISLWTQLGLRRDAWTPILSDAQARSIREVLSRRSSTGPNDYQLAAAIVLAFHSKTIVSDDDLAAVIRKSKKVIFSHQGDSVEKVLSRMLAEMRGKPRKRPK